MSGSRFVAAVVAAGVPCRWEFMILFARRDSSSSSSVSLVAKERNYNHQVILMAWGLAFSCEVNSPSITRQNESIQEQERAVHDPLTPQANKQSIAKSESICCSRSRRNELALPSSLLGTDS